LDGFRQLRIRLNSDTVRDLRVSQKIRNIFLLDMQVQVSVTSVSAQ